MHLSICPLPRAAARLLAPPSFAPSSPSSNDRPATCLLWWCLQRSHGNGSCDQSASRRAPGNSRWLCCVCENRIVFRVVHRPVAICYFRSIDSSRQLDFDEIAARRARRTWIDELWSFGFSIKYLTVAYLPWDLKWVNYRALSLKFLELWNQERRCNTIIILCRIITEWSVSRKSKGRRQTQCGSSHPFSKVPRLIPRASLYNTWPTSWGARACRFVLSLDTVSPYCRSVCRPALIRYPARNGASCQLTQSRFRE